MVKLNRMGFFSLLLGINNGDGAKFNGGNFNTRFQGEYLAKHVAKHAVRLVQQVERLRGIAHLAEIMHGIKILAVVVTDNEKRPPILGDGLFQFNKQSAFVVLAGDGVGLFGRREPSGHRRPFAREWYALPRSSAPRRCRR